MKRLTAQQLYDACRNHQFLLLRYAKDNSVIAVNCKIARFKMFDEFKTKDSATKFISYNPCGFMEYITNKVTFFTNQPPHLK